MRKVLLSDQVCQELKLAYTTSAKGTQALTTCNQEEQQVSTLVTQRLMNHTASRDQNSTRLHNRHAVRGAWAGPCVPRL